MMNVGLDIRNKFLISSVLLKTLIDTAPYRYKVHTIAKRHNRGVRIIAQPKAEIKMLQRFVVNEYLKKMPVHEAAKAYTENRSIKDHAEPHASNKYLLKLDFKNFFNSILSQDFYRYLVENGNFDDNDINLLINLLFWLPKGTTQKILSIGAPSSPRLSNLLMFDFDSQLCAYCERLNITYTRYADDIALSTNTPNLLNGTLEYVTQLCNSLDYPKLQINTDKTIFTSKKWNRSLTGIVLSNEGSISLGRDKKRSLRATAYNYSVGKLSDDQIPTLRGNLAFAYSIEPKFVEKIKEMIGINSFNELMHFTKKSPSLK